MTIKNMENIDWLGEQNKKSNISFGLSPKKDKKKRKQETNWISQSLYNKPAKKIGTLFPQVKISSSTKKSSFSFLPKTKTRITNLNPIIPFFVNKKRPINKNTVHFMKPIKISGPKYNSINKKTTFLSAEQSLYGKRNLKRFGDKDMDGSPNMFDCSPKRVDRDGFFSNLLHKVSGGKWGQSNEDYAAEKQSKADQSLAKEREVEPYAPLGEKELSKQAYAAGDIEKATELDTETAMAEAKKQIDESLGAFQEREAKKKITKERAEELTSVETGLEELKGKIKEQKEYLGHTQEVADIKQEKIKAEEKYLEQRKDVLAEKYIPKIFYGKTKEKIAATDKEGKPLYDAEGKQLYTYKTKTSGILPGMAALASTVGGAIAESAPGLKYNIFNPEAATKTGGWSKAARTAGFQMRKPIAGALSAVLPKQFLTKDVQKLAKSAQVYPGLKKKSKPGSKGKAGRPKGTFKPDQYVPGVGLVGVYDWRKYVRKQNAISRLSGQGQMAPQSLQQSMPQEYYPSPVPQEQQQVYEQPLSQPMYGDTTSNRYMEIEKQIQELKKMQNLNPYQQIQLQQQATDSILLAPQFMKGELTNVGGPNSMTYTPPEGNILNAPNVNMGQMRNINQNEEIPSVKLSTKPITNPFGDQYVDIDTVSGQPILKKRIREKWITGDAY